MSRDSSSDIPAGRFPWGKGLVLFRPGTPPRARRRRTVFAAVTVALCAVLIWPFYAEVPPVEPKVLGLPFGFAWVIGALLVMFAAVVWLYRGDLEDDQG